MTTTEIPCEDVKPGTVLNFLGKPHVVTEIQPREQIPAWEADGIHILGSAIAAGDFRMTLLAGETVRVFS